MTMGRVNDYLEAFTSRFDELFDDEENDTKRAYGFGETREAAMQDAMADIPDAVADEDMEYLGSIPLGEAEYLDGEDAVLEELAGQEVAVFAYEHEEPGDTEPVSGTTTSRSRDTSPGAVDDAESYDSGPGVFERDMTR